MNRTAEFRFPTRPPRPDRVWGPYSVLSNKDRGLRGPKGGDHSSSSVNVENTWSFTFTSPHTSSWRRAEVSIRFCLLYQYRDNKYALFVPNFISRSLNDFIRQHITVPLKEHWRNSYPIQKGFEKICKVPQSFTLILSLNIRREFV